MTGLITFLPNRQIELGSIGTGFKSLGFFREPARIFGLIIIYSD
jgi:hypothetical protein